MLKREKGTTAKIRLVPFLIELAIRRAYSLVFGSEKQGNTPNTRQSDNGVNNSAYYCFLTAANPSNQVELKKANTAPVKRAYNGQYQCDSVKYH